MKESKVALSIFLIVFFCAGLSYFLTMLSSGNVSISLNNEDWGSFGSYLGGILAPAASLLAGYLVYKSLATNTQQQKLVFARETISRLDAALDSQLEKPFSNSIYGEKYINRPIKEIIYALSNNEIEADETSRIAFASLLHNMAIMSCSIKHYIALLEGLETKKVDLNWLGELERAYWIQKYSAICSRMVRIVGKDAIQKKLSSDQLSSFIFVFQGGKEL